MPTTEPHIPGDRTTLNQLHPSSDSTLRPYNVLVGRNLGNMTITFALPMYQFFAMSAVANESGLSEKDIDDTTEVAQRKLDPSHAKKLAVYLLRALLDNVHREFLAQQHSIPNALTNIQSHLSRQPYFATQPIVANLRNASPGGATLPVEPIAPGFARVFLSDADVLWVIDGQHRRYAMDFLFEFLDAVLTTRRYPRRSGLYSPNVQDVPSDELKIWAEVFKTARQGCNVIVDVHLGLTVEQERQIFHDLNNLSKPVAASLAYQFDSSNPINSFIKEKLLTPEFGALRIADGDISNWHADDGSLPYKDVISICARLFINKTTIASADPLEIASRVETALAFWNAVAKIPGWGAAGAKAITVAAQPVFLKGAAKVVYDLAFGRDQDPGLLNKFLDLLPTLDFSHTNPCWQFYQLSESEQRRRLPGLPSFLPPTGDGANRDIGGWDAEERLFRFGAKHNDIFPIIADMLRWMTSLPNRHAPSAEQ